MKHVRAANELSQLTPALGALLSNSFPSGELPTQTRQYIQRLAKKLRKYLQEKYNTKQYELNNMMTEIIHFFTTIAKDRASYQIYIMNNK